MEKTKKRVCKLGATGREVTQSGKERERTEKMYRTLGHPEDNPKRCNSCVFEVPEGKEEEDGPEEVLEEKWLKIFLIWQNASTYRFKKLRKPQTE